MHKEILPVVSNFDAPLIAMILGICGLDASTLIFLFRRGFPLVGHLSAPSIFEKESCVISSDVSSLSENLEDRWSDVERCTMRVDGADFLWQGALSEVSKGWLSGPWDVCDDTRSDCIPVQRFCGRQGEGKLRPCDILKKPLTNKFSSFDTPVSLPCLDDFG